MTIPSTKTKVDPLYTAHVSSISQETLLTDFRRVSNHPGTLTFHGFPTHILDVPVDTHFADPAPGALPHHTGKVLELSVKQELLEDVSWAGGEALEGEISIEHHGGYDYDMTRPSKLFDILVERGREEQQERK